MCGISGYCGNKYNPHILKILNLFNESRGTDSVGIVNNNTRTISLGYKSGDNTGKASIFQQAFNYQEGELDNYTVLQHNRAKSVGVVDLKSAHPYEFIYEKDEVAYRFFFMHNGTLQKPIKLAKKYDKDYNNFNTDSELLGALILEHGIDVLKYYEGGAACAFYWEHDPNSLYLWKGASNAYTQNKFNAYTSAYGAERPLYYANDSTGMYFASEEGFLKGVGFTDTVEVPDNTVLQFNCGVLTDSFEIKREIIPDPVIVRTLPPSTTNSRVSTAIKRSDEYDPRGFIVDRVVHYNGRYYLNKEAMDGVYKVLPDYKLDTSLKRGVLHYFIKGFWIKNKATYDSIMALYEENPKLNRTFSINEFHKEALCWCFNEDNSRKLYYVNCILQSNTLIKPKFCYFYYQTDALGELIQTYHVYQCVAEGLLNQEQYRVALFNNNHTEVRNSDYYYLSTKDECLDVAHNWGWTMEWPEDLGDFPKHFNVHAKYLFNEFIETVDEDLAEFNKLYETAFEDKANANSWYELKYGVPYSKGWPTVEIPF